MCFLKNKKTKKIMSKDSITVSELKHLIKNKPEMFPKDNRTQEQKLETDKAYFDSQPNDEYKRKIIGLKVGDIVINAAGARWIVKEITSYEIVFYFENTNEFATRYTKWSFYKVLTTRIPIKFL